jgi:hypothetical protein
VVNTKHGSIHGKILFFENVHLVFICFGLAEALQAQACNWLMIDWFLELQASSFDGFVDVVFLLQWAENEAPLYSVPTKFLPTQNFWLCV